MKESSLELLGALIFEESVREMFSAKIECVEVLDRVDELFCSKS